mgnify:CR=1 FL=1
MPLTSTGLCRSTSFSKSSLTGEAEVEHPESTIMWKAPSIRSLFSEKPSLHYALSVLSAKGSLTSEGEINPL